MDSTLKSIGLDAIVRDPSFRAGLARLVDAVDRSENIMTLYAYTYTAAECGLVTLPPGTLRLAGFEPTRDPAAADCFIVPCDIRHLSDAQLLALPYLAGNVKRHVLFSIAEYPTRVLPFDGAIVFRTDNCIGIAANNVGTLTWAWAVDDLADHLPLPAGGFQYDVCFQGWRSTELTDRACNSILRSGLKSHISVSNTFYGHIETAASNGVPGAIAQRDALRASFLRTMSESRLSLVPRSKPEGVARWRLYEAMSMGRVSAHLCDGFVPPLPDRIDWSCCQLQIAEREVDRCGDIIGEWLAAHDDSDLVARGALARSCWERWLVPVRWESVWAELVAERLNAGARRD